MRVLSALLVLTLACGDSTTEATCSRPTGLWLLETTQRSGDCGPPGDRLVHLDDWLPGCRSETTYDWAPDNCSFDVEVRDCTVGENTGTQVMSLSRTSDDKWTGLVDLRVRNQAGQSCHSVYDAVASKN